MTVSAPVETHPSFLVSASFICVLYRGCTQLFPAASSLSRVWFSSLAHPTALFGTVGGTERRNSSVDDGRNQRKTERL